MLPTIVSLARRLRRDRRGNITMLFGLLGSMVFVAAGGAIDYGRWMHARYHTARALDAAVLAGGRALQTDNANPTAAVALAKQVYDSNVTHRLGLQNDTINFVTVDNNMGITATGTAQMKTTLLGVVGIHELPVAGTAGTKFPKAKLAPGGGGSSNMEVALMLDVTSSMCDDGVGPCTAGSKITGLKDAAKELVNIVVQADQSTYTSRVAVIPFSTQVRVAPNGAGSGLMSTLTELPATWSGYVEECTQWTGDWGTYDNETGQTTGSTIQCTQTQSVLKSNWKVIPCVTDRMFNDGAYDYTDQAPGSNKWLNANEGSRRFVADDPGSTAPSGSNGATAASPAWQWNYNSDGSCWENSEANQILPLTADKTALTARIDGLEGLGSTAGALGTALTWYTLSPNWQGVWPNDSRPGNYSDLTQMQNNGKPKLRKVAVLMSDGVYNTFRSWKNQDQQTVSNHAKQLCANMKAEGIEIYSVAFALDQLPPVERAIAEDTLKSCGTDLNHFYATLTVDELKEAFKEIALSLTTVYLTE